jgi:hypothetical protein
MAQACLKWQIVGGNHSSGIAQLVGGRNEKNAWRNDECRRARCTMNLVESTVDLAAVRFF